MTRIDLHVAAERGALPKARSWIRDVARSNGLSTDAGQVVELLTSELVSNAVLHGVGPDVVVRAGFDGDHFVVEVSDASDTLPVMRSTGPEIPGGQGMRLVDRLADDWGVEASHGGGKTVWFRVSRSDGF
jgi:anti-sigma regulatory factor (Ser/Thr protein kinase)